MRWVGLVLVLVMAGFLVYLMLSVDETAAPEGLPDPDTSRGNAATVSRGGGASAASAARNTMTDSAQCAQCHADLYDEWKGSHHEIAWKNPLVAQISDQFRNKICLDCHAPRPVLESGLGKRVLARASDRDDGVNCFSCHSIEGGNAMAASTPGLAGACNPVLDVRLATVEHCSVCHNQHGTVDEWAETDFARQDPPVGCIDCHMPEVERRRADGTTYVGRDHTMHAAHDVEVLRQAPRVTTEIADGVVRIAVTNVGAAHNFPTDERARAVDLVVRILDPEGRLVGEEKRDRYRNPYRDEVGLKNTQIRWNETRRYEYPLTIPEGTVHVRLIYKFTPYVPDDEGVAILERTIDFPSKDR